MGDLLRSTEMTLVQFLIQHSAVHETVHEIGLKGIVDFVDLNENLSAFQRPFINEVKRLDLLEKKLNFFQTSLNEAGPLPKQVLDFGNKGEIALENREEIDEIGKENIMEVDLDELETQLEETENDLNELLNNENELETQFIHLLENKSVAKSSGELFHQQTNDFFRVGSNMDDERKPLIEDNYGIGLNFLSGSIVRERIVILERILWRSTRGNMYLKWNEIKKPIKDLKTRKFVHKVAFVVFYQGEKIGEKIQKICQSLGSHLFNISENETEREDLINNLTEQINGLKVVLNKSRSLRINSLDRIKKILPYWYERIKKEKAIYNIMNCFKDDMSKNSLIAQGWLPKDQLEDLKISLHKATESVGSRIPTVTEEINFLNQNITPPTHFRITQFQKGFQAITESYAIANYQEINPSPFNIITFPFLFAVMFGDLGHGLLMTIFSLFVFKKIDKIKKMARKDEIVKLLYDGRFIILMMGLFSMFTGLIYNEIFAVPMDLFGTCWTPRKNSTVLDLKSKNCCYPFGVDPSWADTTTELLNSNSLKMKLSVLFGIIQMVLGIILSLFNHIHFKQFLNIWFEFIPEILLLLSFFGYMCFLIIYKWLTNWNHREGQTGGIILITTLINFFLKPGTVAKDQQIYKHQDKVQSILAIIFVLSIPLMLIPKPFILRHRWKKKQRNKNGYIQINGSDDDDENGKSNKQEEKFEFGEVFIHQMIHTIEFVLGSISNTASYLRLWALSLAHSQLSKVFWQMIFLFTLRINIPGTVAIGFCIWACTTFVVLMIMESLSAFLHALRLHWVEFNNKFYKGEYAIKFVPFNYKQIEAEANDLRD
ncbi:v-type proton atpase subunit a [Anaeramoeba flamelloides]|uniref:V-type proton ATPase subunit a n=1 Tax=Anaeramoeba flamelloides TaxID=1746091 RepID=A0ABQ8YPI4_9EUKA|nr:v-type proton atpase subunit a [Anaeramoeba flamelloides]